VSRLSKFGVLFPGDDLVVLRGIVSNLLYRHGVLTVEVEGLADDE